jgi:hypothetical protein
VLSPFGGCLSTKLHSDAEACSTISQTATNEAKRKVFVALAETYRNLASEMERAQPLTPSLTKNAEGIYWAF